MTISAAAVACLLSWAIGCASGEACKRDPITGMEQCQLASGSYGEAIGTAAAAAAATAAVGCTVNGCEPPFRCNSDTKLCERIRCTEGKASCPPAYTCDPEQGVCK